jgi:hypothetical protein
MKKKESTRQRLKRKPDTVKNDLSYIETLSPAERWQFIEYLERIGNGDPLKFWAEHARVSKKDVMDLEASEMAEILYMQVTIAAARRHDSVSIPARAAFVMAYHLSKGRRKKGGQERLLLQRRRDSMAIEMARAEKERLIRAGENSTQAELAAADLLSETVGWSVTTSLRRLQTAAQPNADSDSDSVH